MEQVALRILLFGLLLPSAMGGFSGCTSYQIEPNNFTVDNGPMPYQELHSCGPGPPDFEARWSLTNSIVAQLEEDIPELRKMKASSGGLLGWKIDDLNRHHRFYYGIIVEGRKLVYISNGSTAVCDCGPGCWTVLYDPMQRQFLDLAFGGIA